MLAGPLEESPDEEVTFDRSLLPLLYNDVYVYGGIDMMKKVISNPFILLELGIQTGCSETRLGLKSFSVQGSSYGGGRSNRSILS